MDKSPFDLIAILGHTAAGKTAFAANLASGVGAEIISADSRQVYRGMDIGTAKPDTETLRQAPHELIDIIEPDEVYSAGQFCEDALGLMGQSVENQRIPLLVGGTMLYFNALQKGIADMPDVPDSAAFCLYPEQILSILKSSCCQGNVCLVNVMIGFGASSTGLTP